MTYDEAINFLGRGGSLPLLAEALAVVLAKNDAPIPDIMLGLDHPGFIQEQAALALYRKTATPLPGDRDALMTSKVDWARTLGGEGRNERQAKPKRWRRIRVSFPVGGPMESELRLELLRELHNFAFGFLETGTVWSGLNPSTGNVHEYLEDFVTVMCADEAEYQRLMKTLCEIGRRLHVEQICYQVKDLSVIDEDAISAVSRKDLEQIK